MRQEQSGQRSDRGGTQGTQGQRDSSRGQPAEKRQQRQDQQQPAGGQDAETPEQWLEENSLGDPTQTGNTITGENEY